jgi:putative DNA primase/helicase
VGDGDEDEMRKSFIAILLSGASILNLDNIVEGRPLNSPDLAKILTQSSFQGRLLGTNQTPELPTNLTVLGTGNNFSVTGDLTTRTLLCKLDAGIANPEERKFNIANLSAYLREHRVALVTDALTILKAWHYAGKPDQAVKRWGGFDQWSREIREPIVWLGLDELTDPCETRTEVAAQDPEREFHREVLNRWYSRYSNREMVIRDIIDELRNIDKDNDSDWLSKMQLKTALLNVVGDSRLASAISARRFGKWCSQIDGRIIDGLRLSRVGIRTNATTWRVSQVP